MKQQPKECQPLSQHQHGSIRIRLWFTKSKRCWTSSWTTDRPISKRVDDQDVRTLFSSSKLVGSKLEQLLRRNWTKLQNELVKLCQDSDLDLEWDFKFLRLWGHRSFGWTSNRGMEEFYMDKFNDARKAKKMSMTAQSPLRSTSAANKFHQNSTNPVERSKETEANVTNDDEFTRTWWWSGTPSFSGESKDRRVVQLRQAAARDLLQLEQRCPGDRQRWDVARSGAGVNAPLRRPRRMEVEYVASEAVGSSLKYSRRPCWPWQTSPACPGTPRSIGMKESSKSFLDSSWNRARTEHLRVTCRY